MLKQRFGLPFGLALVHYLSIRRVGDPGGLEQVPYTRAWCSSITGSIEYDHIPWFCRGRRQVVTTLSVCHVQAWFAYSPTFNYGVESKILLQLAGRPVLDSLPVCWRLKSSPNRVLCLTFANLDNFH
jgi:hypothetical protein